MSARERLFELDLLRGLSVLGMVLVITPGDWSMRFGWLEHADWAGFSLADMIFPGFLFCVGASLPFALARRIEAGESQWGMLGYVFRRAALLIVLGVLINAFPLFDWSQTRLPGVLQRIALCWALVALLVYCTGRSEGGRSFEVNTSLLAAVAVAILIGYWLLLALVPVPGFGGMRFDAVGSWPAFVDRAVFGPRHLWPYGISGGLVSYDPEGLLATLPACVNVILGTIVAGNARLLRSKLLLFAMGVGMIFAGILFAEVFPSIKKIWSSSFVLISGGFTLLCLVCLGFLSELRIPRKVMQPLRVYGTNALASFCVFMLLATLLDIPLASSGQSLRQMGFSILRSLVDNPQWASLLFSLVLLAGFYCILLFCYRRGWFLKI